MTHEFRGPVSSFADHDFEFSAQAEKRYGPLGFTHAVKVINVPNIGKFPRCTPTEGYRYEGVTVR